MVAATIKEAFLEIMRNEDDRSLFEKNLHLASIIKPDKQTNPCQSLDEFYVFLDWIDKCLPWNILNTKEFPDLFTSIDQSINYFWFLFDIELDELKDRGYYRNSLQYHEPFASWIKYYSKKWGEYLSSEESWNDEYFKLQFEDDAFGMNKGWYGNANIWKTYNDFFSRHLIDKSVRPIGGSNVVAPADSKPQGIWKISEDGYIEDKLQIKSRNFYKINNILGPDSKYLDRFNGGTLTHMFLNVYDYHRYHFPVSGKIVELKKIDGLNAVGGHTLYDPETKHYILHCDDTAWQMIETRDSVILETECGLVACLPIGMSQVCSCNFEENLKVGDYVKKGDPLGYFLFGGSDFVIIFEKGIEFKMMIDKFQHILMGENYGEMKRG